MNICQELDCRRLLRLVSVLSVFGLLVNLAAGETLPPLEGSPAPQTVDALWAGFDPRAEPLDVEILKEWEEDEVVLRVLRYRIGMFKGKKSMMAAVYGFPKGGEKLPGLVQIHGGGQYADSNAVLTNAKRGYATISIAWAGRISAPDYRVSPNEVKLFWEGKTDDPAYRLTTDWGAVEAYHAPGRYPQNNFPTLAKAAPWALDSIESPRNNSWFLCALGARRALTFLEQQKEVDPEKLGVYGHSMGGKLTVLTTGSDARVKAAAPSCGGMSDRSNDNPLYRSTIGDDAYLKNIQCPIVFLSPANDFHGRIDDLQTAVSEIQSDEWRITCSPHHNHQDNAEYEVATQLWFDQHLKGSFSLPLTPVGKLELGTGNSLPRFTVRPDASMRILSVDIFYTRHGQIDGDKDDRDNTIARFWHHAPAAKQGESWSADLPITDLEKPLWAYANVAYALEEPVTGAGYYYRTYTAEKFILSSLMAMVTPEQLKEAKVKATLQPTLTLESFEDDWEKEWFTYRTEEWGRRTHKVYDDRWKAPTGAKLAFEVRSDESNTLVLGVDDHATEIDLDDDSKWQSIELDASAFQNVKGEALQGWDGIRELRFGAEETLRAKPGGKDANLKLGGAWKGKKPEFRNLRWVEKDESPAAN